MVFSIIMHAFIGYFGTAFLTWTPKGIIFALALALATQASNIFMEKKKLIMKAEKAAYKEQIAKGVKKKDLEKMKKKMEEKGGSSDVVVENMKQLLINSFIKNTAICTIVTLFVSEMARSNRLGF